VISPLTLTIAGVILVFVAIVGVMTRRLKASSQFELGAVSQQWLLGHRDEG
jgi:hypothetical protein